MPVDYDVLIVGAGPTGLMMAAECSRYGISCKIIDKSPSFCTESRALAIQPRTMEIFHFLGLDAEFLHRGQKIKALNPISGQKPLGHIDFSKIESPFPFILSLPQSQTEEILHEYLSRLGPKVERGHELVGIEEEDSIVTAEIATSSKEHYKVKTKWVVGCDGAHSFIRKYLNQSFIGKSFRSVFSLADVEISWKYPHDEGFVFLTKQGPLAAIPLPHKNHYRLIFQLDRCQTEKGTPSEDNLQVEVSPPTIEEVQTVVHSYADKEAVLSPPKWIANFHVNSRLVKEYRVGKFFLAGDAAHIHSPIGGQGMNTGLQDAFNLGWKLALACKQEVSPELLHSYHVERHSVASGLLKGTEAATQIATLEKGWEISLRNFIASLLFKNASLVKKLIHTITQLNIQYPKSPLLSEKGTFARGPKVGSRMPDFSLKKGDKSIQLYDLFMKTTSFTVLIFEGERSEASETALTQLEQIALPMKIISISKNGPYQDEEGKMHHTFGAEKGACYVVRPDTYVGYRQTPINEMALLDYFDQF